MLKITNDNYDHYKDIYDVLWSFTETLNGFKYDDESYSPIAVLNSWEKRSKSLAKKGLKTGILDSITMLMDQPANVKNEIENCLINRGLPGFRQLVSIVKDIHQKVLKKGRIANLDEYYIIKELLCDSKTDITETQQIQLQRIYENFEANYNKR